MLVHLDLRQGKCLAIFFELRKDGLISPANNTMTTTDPKLQVKIEPQDPDQQNPSTKTPKTRVMGWGPNCPIYKNAEDWDGKHQNAISAT